MIANRIQFDAVKHDIFHPNQLGSIHQRSTEDAGLILTHLVQAGWVKGLQTSVLAFDIMQFFPSINHEMFMAVLRKQGFLPVLVEFFASYLVGRSTVYCWNTFQSDSWSADMGVGQGSALSPVISGLFIALVMKLFYIKAAPLNTTLLSFVDDRTILAQSKQLDDNNVGLRKAYKIIYLLFVAFALVLEHDKTELFHFSRRRDAYNPSLDLGYAPHTRATPLKPKTYWRYLGFYFDRGLMFHEHVRYYATKAFTTMQAMRMLGNSTRGLSPKQCCLLYRSCVVPIATYSYRLWYFDGACNKGAMNQLKWMQRKAALWITGAFCTSPTGGLEALAGLIPVHLMLKKLVTCAVYRVATLSDTHPLRSMMGEGLLKRAEPHACSAVLMTPAMRGKVKSTIMEVDKGVHTLTESFEPFAPEARPGVPSALRWDIHGEAHKYVTELKVRVGRRKTDNSIDALRSQAAHSVLDSWSSTFQDPTYRGSEFLELQQPDGRLLQPSYLNGGPWLSTFGHSITEFAHVCQCITGHAPIGAYYCCFKINEPHGCTCGLLCSLASTSSFAVAIATPCITPAFLGILHLL
ncbi:unnamed protein product [Cyclocybe aegerita]|uniref:Reverse transcriptase domain-containing protein n=1 Tax=Cyclocybe aegerita TaxID=1973307 RepID=A0A8S0W933_CYCAE|nr:unnamed protein product [Cyclocybe aegerita]